MRWIHLFGVVDVHGSFVYQHNSQENKILIDYIHRTKGKNMAKEWNKMKV